jgi:hypothetical protein
MLDYDNNYRRNLTLYWRQYYPTWSIPTGYHVHHIKPKSEGGTNHPRNLIALHPDDHQTIHHLRGDKRTADGILSVRGYTHNEDTRRKIREKRATQVMKPRSLESRERSRQASVKGPRPPEVIRKMSISATGLLMGRRNGNFDGWYITPWGKFESLKATMNSCPCNIGEKAINRLCKTHNAVSLSFNSASQIPYLGKLAAGKIPADLGFGFTPK